MLDGNPEDRAAIDVLVRRFFDAFTNAGGIVPDTEGLAGLFLESAVISKAVAGLETYAVHSFIEPRAKLLTDGNLVDFREEETESRTDIVGSIAQRISLYRKSGTMMGERFEGRGVKVFQLVRAAGGWRIAALAWDDERDGFSIPASL
ncbi:MAG: nuclear transport factor 2 family protein [Alphaproteobacteria bacterium]|nr:nuclear transport factor 2 family protein [Alphaproteobacteria bacterium]